MRPPFRNQATALLAACVAVAASIVTVKRACAVDGQAMPKPAPCASAEHRQFDFWIGRWDVFDTTTGERAGSSIIESLYAGCTLRENWTEPGFTGGSLNTYDATDRRWHQTWTDSSGAWREFVGGIEDGRMVLVWRHASARDPGRMVDVRMTFTRNADGSVRQHSDVRIEDGDWTERYDYTYRPAR